MPIVLMGAVGMVLVFRSGRRLEALTLAGVVVVYFLFNAGVEHPLGGGGRQGRGTSFPCSRSWRCLSRQRFAATR